MYKRQSKLIVYLTSDVKYRQGARTVTSSGCTLNYLVSPEESLGSTVAADLWVQDICKLIFGISLDLDFSESDGADGFITGAIVAWTNSISILNCTFHAVKNIGSVTSKKFKEKCNTSYCKKYGTFSMRFLQYFKTQKQFDACLALFLDNWKDNGETKATAYVLIEYGTYPHNRWWYCAARKSKTTIIVVVGRKPRIELLSN